MDTITYTSQSDISTLNALHKVLIIDDDPSILEAISMVLVRKNMDVVAINDATRLQSTLLEYEPDLLLMDISMGEYDGRNLCLQIKKSQMKLPVILFSAQTFTDASIEECSADAVLRKPFRLKDLYDMINRFLH